MQYGDARRIIDAQNLAIRHLAAALRCALGLPDFNHGAATGHKHVDHAIAEIELAESVARNTDDPDTVLVPHRETVKMTLDVREVRRGAIIGDPDEDGPEDCP